LDETRSPPLTPLPIGRPADHTPYTLSRPPCMYVYPGKRGGPSLVLLYCDYEAVKPPIAHQIQCFFPSFEFSVSFFGLLPSAFFKALSPLVSRLLFPRLSLSLSLVLAFPPAFGNLQSSSRIAAVSNSSRAGVFSFFFVFIFSGSCPAASSVPAPPEFEPDSRRLSRVPAGEAVLPGRIFSSSVGFSEPLSVSFPGLSPAFRFPSP